MVAAALIALAGVVGAVLVYWAGEEAAPAKAAVVGWLNEKK